MIGSRTPCQLGEVFTTLELSNLPGDIKEQKNIEKQLFLGIFPPLDFRRNNYGFFFYLSGLPISKYIKYSHFEQARLCTIYVYLAKLTKKLLQICMGHLKYFITISLKILKYISISQKLNLPNTLGSLCLCFFLKVTN